MLICGLLVSGVSCRILRRRRPPPPPPPRPERPLRLPPRGMSLTDFEQTAGWRVESLSGTAEWIKTPQRAIWGDFAGLIRYTARGPGPHVVTLIPDEPWLVRSPFNLLSLWVWDDGEDALRPDHRIELEAVAPGGVKLKFSFPYSPAGFWRMLHLRKEEGFPWPLLIKRLRWYLPDESEGIREIYLEGLRAQAETYPRIPREIQYVRPHEYAPAFAPRRDDSVLLGFPPTPAAFRPVPPAGRTQARILRESDQRYLFRYEGAEGILEYGLELTAGVPQIDVRVDGVSLGQLWSGFGLELEGDLPEFRFARIEEDTLFLQYAQGLRLRVSLHGRTLQIEAHALGETVQALKLGSLGGGNRGYPLYPPFLRVGEEMRWPVYVLQTPERELFVSLLPDWWYSMAGEVSPPGRSADGREDFGRLIYPERWKGTRNVCRERIYFTVSPRFEDVLPGPSAVESFQRQMVGSRLWTLLAPFPREPLLLGVRPDTAEWNEDWLARSPQGDWIALQPPAYLLKAARFPDEGLQRVLRHVREQRPAYLFLPEAGLPPWRWTDYDARVLGAGTFSQTWAEFGVLLMQAGAETSLPTLAPGGCEWLLAGLGAAFVPHFPLGLQELHPYLPQFAHRNILPYSALLGLGELHQFQLPGRREDDEETLMHRLLAAQIAYGACGRVPNVRDPGLRLRARRILAPLHERFTRQTLSRVSYWDGNRFVGISEAMASGALLRSQVYFRFEDGTEVWVNGDFQDDWILNVAGETLELPPSGFVVRGEDLLMHHARKDGVIRTRIQTPDQLWIDPPPPTP